MRIPQLKIYLLVGLLAFSHHQDEEFRGGVEFAFQNHGVSFQLSPVASGAVEPPDAYLHDITEATIPAEYQLDKGISGTPRVR